MPAWTSANTKLTRNPVKILLAVGIVAIVILAAGALGTRLWYRQKQAQVEAEQAVKQKAEQEIATQLKTDLGKAKQEIISLQEKLNDIERQKAEQAKADIHLDGEVFIATKGGESVKLGLVPIALFSISKLLACLSNEQAIAIKEIARLTSEEKADEVQQNGDPYGWLKFYLREKIVAEHNKIFARTLATSTRGTKTNSDGKFQIQVPRSDEYALVATASRFVSHDPVPMNRGGTDNYEHYYWLIRIDPHGESPRKIALSNDNLFHVENAMAFRQTVDHWISEP